MSIWDKLSQGVGQVLHGLAPTPPSQEALARQETWARALDGKTLPDFVQRRLVETAAGRLPWLTTATPAELLLQKTHGIRPLGFVSGNCWYHFGYSWTQGHMDGWHGALDRLRSEAFLMGANAVVDVQMRVRKGEADDMDYAVSGTAIRIDSLPESSNPLVATVSAVEFVRLLEGGMVPVGVAIGAYYDWYQPPYGQARGERSWWNQELTDVSAFQQQVRRRAIYALGEDGQRLGGSVLAHTQFTQMARQEGDSENPERFLCRHIAIGTVIDHDRRATPGIPARPVYSLGQSLLTASSRQKRPLV